VQTVRPALERFYRSLSDEQKARFNAIAPTDDANAAGKDQRNLENFCDEKSRRPPAPRGDSTWVHFGGNSSMVRPSKADTTPCTQQTTKCAAWSAE
jgi:hypothetical protein